MESEDEVDEELPEPKDTEVSDKGNVISVRKSRVRYTRWIIITGCSSHVAIDSKWLNIIVSLVSLWIGNWWREKSKNVSVFSKLDIFMIASMQSQNWITISCLSTVPIFLKPEYFYDVTSMQSQKFNYNSVFIFSKYGHFYNCIDAISKFRYNSVFIFLKPDIFIITIHRCSLKI